MVTISGRKRAVLLTALTVGVLAVSLAAECSFAASSYPTRPITMIVPYGPGGGSDLSARLIAAYASKKLGQPVNVANVIGASGITGTMQCLSANPDGYTLMVVGTSNSSFLAASRADLPFRLEGMKWMGQWIADPQFYLFSAATPFKTLKEAMDFAKSTPEKFSWGAGAQGSQAMFQGLVLLNDAGVDIVKTRMVVFPEGVAASVQATLAGTVMMSTAMATDVDKLMPTGKVKVLAAITKERLTKYPNFPTAKEFGYSNAILMSWYGISGPKNLPQDVVDAWDKLATEAAKDPEFQASADKMNKALAFLGPKEQEAYVMKEYADMKTLAEKVGIRK
ncbi:MAG: tripartite tricarboxylate transporter substrate binding protein [Planctomycetota bacterium]